MADKAGNKYTRWRRSDVFLRFHCSIYAYQCVMAPRSSYRTLSVVRT